jgi:Cu/Ag efflux protein CusF
MNPVLAAMALTVALGLGVSVAPAQVQAEEPQALEVIGGEVTKIDLERKRVTVRSSDGGVHEFEASEETLKDLKVGDRIEAKRRPTTSTTD